MGYFALEWVWRQHAAGLGRFMVTAAEAQRIIEETKVIDSDLMWTADGIAYRLRALVKAEVSGETLTLQGYVGRKNRSFALVYRDTPIRRYTVHDFHVDPVTRERVTGPHKHTWDDIWGGRRVYIPRDIRIGDPNLELMDFLDECNVSLRGFYIPRSFVHSGG